MTAVRRVGYVFGGYNAISDADARRLVAVGPTRLRVVLTIGTFITFAVAAAIASIPLWFGDARSSALYVVAVVDLISIPALWWSAGQHIQQLEVRYRRALLHDSRWAIRATCQSKSSVAGRRADASCVVGVRPLSSAGGSSRT